ncbi:MAG: hypothetical protein ACXWZP_04565 [Gaiellaceae bacterium]
MSDPRAATLLAHAAELQRRDDAVAEAIGSVGDLLARADVVRARATGIREALAARPAELARVDEAEAEARRREELARVDLAAAERRLEDVTRSRRAGEEAVAQARREVTRARETLADAGARVVRIIARREAHVDSGRVLQAEAEGLVVAARDIAARIRRTPRVSESGREQPGTTLPELEEWGARVHAASQSRTRGRSARAHQS